MAPERTRKRLTIAILAIGGQGGGVLSDWIGEMASHHGWLAQATSVPGVAQRTGSTVYYLELYPDDGAEAGGREPLMGLMPAPGDLDVVVASELMEAGRAMVQGLVSPDRTVLITSTHRVYAIGEKSAMSDGRADSGKVLEAAPTRARRFVSFDMEAAADQTGSVISSVLFGALCGAKALPFSQAQYEQAIRAGGKAVERNLAGFHAGVAGAQAAAPAPATAAAAPTPTTEAGRIVADRIAAEIPPQAQLLALEGAKRLMDYQDRRYAHLFLDRLAGVRALDDGADQFALTAETARHLALWMSYEDTIRVADLKTRASRFDRVRAEVRARPEQVLQVTEFMSPRLREVCETMPAPIGRAFLDHKALSALLAPFFGKGRHVTTTGIGWFLAMRFLAALRPLRPTTLRYQEEQERIDAWLDLVRQAAASDRAAALELVKCQRLVRGYGDTHARGLRNFGAVIDAYQAVRARPDAAAVVRSLCEAALADEYGVVLAKALAELGLAAPQAPEAAMFRIDRRLAS